MLLLIVSLGVSMAIIIPSKSIYENDNNKIIDNHINGIDYDETNIDYNLDIGSIVHSVESTGIVDVTSPSGTLVSQVTDKWVVQSENIGKQAVCYVKVHYGTVDIVVPKQTLNNTIEKIYYGLDDDNKENISYTLKGYKYTGTASYEEYTNSSGTVSPSTVTISYGEPEPFNDKITDFTSSVTFTSISSYTIIAKVDNLINVGTVEPTITDDSYSFHFVFPKLVEKYTITGNYDRGTAAAASGTAEKYEISTVSLTFRGEEYKFTTSTSAVKIGGSSNLSLDSNELMQSTTLNGETKIGAYIADKVINSYANGKETAKIKCSINNFYYEDGTIAKSITSKRPRIDTSSITLTNDTSPIFGSKITVSLPYRLNGYNLYVYVKLTDKISDLFVILNGWSGKSKTYSTDYENPRIEYAYVDAEMTFKIGDRVIPQIFTASGDQPMSKNSDGTPKVFKVLGVNIINNGALWQELTLQEV